MANSDVLFLGLAQNCGPTAKLFVESLERFEKDGLRVRAIVGENGSTDNTRDILASSPLVRIVDTSRMSSIENRFDRMVLGRQIVADAARAVDADFVAVVDLDEPMLAKIQVVDLRNAFDVLRGGRYFAVGATSLPTYYDLLAYVDEDENFVGLETEIRSRRGNPFSYLRYFRTVVYPSQRRLTRSDDVAVLSSFNGLVVYARSDYYSGRYSSLGGEVCEHVGLHFSIRQATGLRHMLISANLIVPTPLSHGRRGAAAFVWQRLPQLLPRRR